MSNITIINTQLTETISKESLPQDDTQKLLSSFAVYTVDVQGILEESKIVVTSVDDKEGMKRAREIRLKLKDIRVNVEKTRKELKEDSLRYGRAIDGVANVLKQMIEPAENHLQKQEDFAKEQERIKKEKIANSRASILLGLNVDIAFFNLVDMTDEEFDLLHSRSQIAFDAIKESEERAKAERIAQEKAIEEERERVRKENEELKKQNEILIKQKEQEKIAQETAAKIEAAEKEKIRLENEELKRKNDLLIEKERLEKEAEEKRIEEEEKKRQEELLIAELAPDKEKTIKYLQLLKSIPTPEIKSTQYNSLIKIITQAINKSLDYCNK